MLRPDCFDLGIHYKINLKHVSNCLKKLGGLLSETQMWRLHWNK